VTPSTFAALYSNPAREHDPLMVRLKEGGRYMVTGFDGTYAELHGGGRVAVAALRRKGGELVEG
jgi:hypothetical protein